MRKRTDRYDERDFRAIDQSGRLDANETIFFARELEYIKAQTYDIEYPNLSGLNLIPISSEVSPGAESVSYYQYDKVGFAKIISNYSTDLPRVDLKGKRFFAPVKSIGVSYGYSIQDIRAAQMAGKPLEQRKAAAARDADSQEVNRIALFGDTDSGLVGLLTHPNITSYTLPADGTSSATKFSAKTADQTIRDLNGMVTSMINLTMNVEIPDTVIFTPGVRAYLASTPRSSYSDTTILDFWLQKNGYIKNVEVAPELTGAGTNGTDMMMIYKKSPQKLTLELPQPFEQFPPEIKGLEYVISCHSRCAGILCYYPLSLMKASGC